MLARLRVAGLRRSGRARGAGRAHGGATAAVLDEVSAFAVYAAGLPGWTVSLSVEYLRYIPLETYVRVSAAVQAASDRAATVVAQLHDHAGGVYARATAQFARRASRL
eukprot:TRINITY_DN3208_c0_g1_i1.p2 TRINITY_DN3208_c0_g1~~TRINITY_DN3208_c0_g1_i1.p2  ORF type:complete len:108 (-),score=24.14 TRINITY_DN3208_c0_g1_i1:16-339(-)